jgi:hypothetical protein
VKVVFTPEMHAKVAWIVLHGTSRSLHGTSRSPGKVIEHVLRGETATPEGIHHILDEWIADNFETFKFYENYPLRYWTFKP